MSGILLARLLEVGDRLDRSEGSRWIGNLSSLMGNLTTAKHLPCGSRVTTVTPIPSPRWVEGNTVTTPRGWKWLPE